MTYFYLSLVLLFQTNRIERSDFQLILDTSEVKGTILLYDQQADIYFSNDFDWAKKGQLPASTYKIPHSIIALETGVVEHDSVLFTWDGSKRFLQIWEQDLVFKDAFRLSCVPCYKGIARDIGINRMRNWLSVLKYGNINVDSGNIDKFWLEGSSRISPFQQIDFLKKFRNNKLSISDQTSDIVKNMMIIDSTEDSLLRGKTGWSITNEVSNGWFVGYLETNNNTIYFATNIQPKEGFNMDNFGVIRKEITLKALRTK